MINREPGIKCVLNCDLYSGIGQDDHTFYLSEELFTPGWLLPWENGGIHGTHSKMTKRK